MKKVLLVNNNRCEEPYPVFPLGLTQIASALKTASFDFSIFDLLFHDTELQQRIKDFIPDYIGISIRNIDDVRIINTRLFMPDCQESISRIRAITGVPIILGGSGFSIFPEQILSLTGADYGIAGEAEESIVKLLHLLEENSKPAVPQLEQISGLVFRDGGKVRMNPQKVIDRKCIGRPYFPEQLVKKYVSKSSMLNLQTQRGCPFNCIYCSYPIIEGQQVRYRDADEVVDDICKAVSLGVEYFFIVDSVFNISEDHVANICNRILQQNLKIEWGCFLRPSNISSELMKLMARAGLKHIEFGSDSFCDEILSSYGKMFTFEDIFTSSEIARKERVHYAHFLIIGGPGETEKTLLKSYDNSKCLKKTVVFTFKGMRLFPGTPLYNIAIKENTVDYCQSMLEPVFYLSSLISDQKIESLLKSFQNESHRWIIGDSTPEQKLIMERLRNVGVNGPLWEYLTR